MAKVKRIKHLLVGDFFRKHGEHLHLELIGGKAGLERKIFEPSINRPGLALAGFYLYFAYKRIQVLGNSEFAYLGALPEREQAKRFEEMCACEIPCVVVCRNRRMPESMLKIAEAAGVAVFRTTLDTMRFINACTLWMDWEFAPTTTEHGCMVDVKGIGVLIKGDSGAGKSEAVLGLLERGAALVADDMVKFCAPEGRDLEGSSTELGRFHMEVRGIGVVNVPLLFGAASMRIRKRLDLVVYLKPLESFPEMDRLGMEVRHFSVLDREVPLIELPVGPGRDTARLVEVAALEQKLRSFGHHSAVEFGKNLLRTMEEQRIS
ncbi:MAG: HPr kinase/phosphorylase [Verrucomicrobiales bacterium]|nr:HPr kinase/phosphorylase [Verrucomicrobiales bacterium]